MTLKADLLTPQTANYSGHDLLENGLVPPPPDHKRGAINEVPFASGQMALNRLPERFQRASGADHLPRMPRVVFTSVHSMLSGE